MRLQSHVSESLRLHKTLLLLKTIAPNETKEKTARGFEFGATPRNSTNLALSTASTHDRFGKRLLIFFFEKLCWALCWVLKEQLLNFVQIYGSKFFMHGSRKRELNRQEKTRTQLEISGKLKNTTFKWQNADASHYINIE